MDDDTVMAVLKNSRKVRKQTTCYPCQRRKVKCDRRLPCSVCISRGHSFLCTYGRPTESSKTIPMSALGSEDVTTSASSPVSQLSALREHLNSVHHELQETRKRHRQCEEAEDQVRRLQARCRKYEDMHVSLRAGDWSVLAQINGIIHAGSDTSIATPDGSRNSQSNDASTTRCSRVDCGSTAHSPESKSCVISLTEVQQDCLPVGNTMTAQQPKTSSRQGESVSELDAVPGLSRAIDSGATSHHHTRVFRHDTQFRAPNLSDGAESPHRTASRYVQQSQVALSLAHSNIHGETLALQSSLRSVDSPSQTNPQARCGQPLRVPFLFQNAGTIVSDPILDQTKIYSGVPWMQTSLYPPMMYSQDMQFMEQNYADYWARIMVEAQESALLVG